jgi:hypothetical protein
MAAPVHLTRPAQRWAGRDRGMIPAASRRPVSQGSGGTRLATAPGPPSRAPSLSATDAPSAARVTLPSDLPGSLKYLDDAQLQRLREAVSAEIDRRTHTTRQNKAGAMANKRASSPSRSKVSRNDKIKAASDIPAGKVNLIQASFRAGLKPAAIARTLRISETLVRRVLAAERPKS